MPTTTDKKIILTGGPMGWVHKISEGAITELWKFDNLQKSTYKIAKPGTAASSGENLDITRNDGVVFRFPKINKILDGTDETDITPADASSDATGKGEITLITNEAPNEANGWTAFVADVKKEHDSLLMFTIPMGFSHKARNDASMRKPEGYIHLIGKINNDIEGGENPASLTLTLVAYKNSGLEATDLTSTTLFTPITWKLGGTGSDITGIKPPDITADGAADLLAGDILVVPAITYS